MKKLKLAFVGLGWIGRHRMQALVEQGLMDDAVFADVNGLCIDEALKIFPGASVAERLEQVDFEGVDGVVLATPSALHAQQTISTLNAGCPVFCQKPLARSAEECRLVVDAAKVNDKLLGVDFSYRYLEAISRMKDLLDNGAIGKVYSVDTVFHNAYGPDKAWFYDPRLAGGGCVMDLGVHLVDLVLWLLGFPDVRDVHSRLFRGGVPFSGEGVEDFASVHLDLGNDAQMRMACSWNLPAGQDAQIECTLYGTAGALSLKNVNGSFYDFRLERFWGTSREVLADPPDSWGGRAAVAWAAKVSRGETGFDSSAEQFCNVCEVLDKIYSASACFSTSEERSGIL